MTESQFLRSVEETLAQIETSLDAARVPADCSLTGLVMNVELDDGSRIVINGQTPMRQLWLASRSGAMHFAHDGACWRDLRTGVEFFEALSRVVSEHLGREVRLDDA